jgi:FAD synthetase
MKTVIAFGTFDLLHAGHLHYLQQAKALGDKLIVVVARDETVKETKGKLPVNDEQHRLEMIAALKPVDNAVLGFEKKKMFECVAKLKPAVLALGYDQQPDDETIKQAIENLDCFPKIIRLKPFKEHKHKTSKIKEKIRADCK